MTAFTLEGGQYQFSRLPQGYLNSPAIAHNLLTQDIQAFQENATHRNDYFYIDDILIYGDNLEEQNRVKRELIEFLRISHTQKMDDQLG